MYFQARYYCCIKSLKMEPKVETATQEVFNSFFYYSPCALAGTHSLRWIVFKAATGIVMIEQGTFFYLAMA